VDQLGLHVSSLAWTLMRKPVGMNETSVAKGNSRWRENAVGWSG
jgi:hypothetical protein